MSADHRAGALPVDVQVADVELIAGAFDLGTIVGVNRSRQTVFRIVDEFECSPARDCYDPL